MPDPADGRPRHRMDPAGRRPDDRGGPHLIRPVGAVSVRPATRPAGCRGAFEPPEHWSRRVFDSAGRPSPGGSRQLEAELQSGLGPEHGDDPPFGDAYPVLGRGCPVLSVVARMFDPCRRRRCPRAWRRCPRAWRSCRPGLGSPPPWLGWISRGCPTTGSWRCCGRSTASCAINRPEWRRSSPRWGGARAIPSPARWPGSQPRSPTRRRRPARRCAGLGARPTASTIAAR